MFVNKIGKDHVEIGLNCQDYGFEDIENNLKLVCDGCGEGANTEVGAKMFSHLVKYANLNVINNIQLGLEMCFAQIEDFFSEYKKVPSIAKDFMCFTILFVRKYASSFQVVNCGDGFIILEDKEGKITFEELNDGAYPKYFVYNYMNPKYLKSYKDGVDFEERFYSFDDYNNVGVASDGIRFIVNSNDEELKQEFKEILKTKSGIKMKRFINKNQKIFKDDVTISF